MHAYRSRTEGLGINEVIVGRKVEFVLTTRNADHEGEQCNDERDCVTAKIRHFQGQDCNTRVQTQNSRDGLYMIRYFAKEAGRKMRCIGKDKRRPYLWQSISCASQTVQTLWTTGILYFKN